MRFPSWKPRHLMLAWSAYWAGLLAWGLGSFIPAALRVTRDDAKGSISLNFGDGGFHLTAADAGTTVWDGQIGLGKLIVLVAVPPLVLFGVWLFAQSRRPVVTAEEIPHQLGSSEGLDRIDPIRPDQRNHAGEQRPPDSRA